MKISTYPYHIEKIKKKFKNHKDKNIPKSGKHYSNNNDGNRECVYCHKISGNKSSTSILKRHFEEKNCQDILNNYNHKLIFY